MNKMRVYELAKELGISSKELISTVSNLKIDAHNHMSTLEDGEVKTIKEHYTKSNKKENEKEAVKTNNNENVKEANKENVQPDTKPNTNQGANTNNNTRPNTNQNTRPNTNQGARPNNNTNTRPNTNNNTRPNTNQNTRPNTNQGARPNNNTNTRPNNNNTKPSSNVNTGLRPNTNKKSTSDKPHQPAHAPKLQASDAVVADVIQIEDNHVPAHMNKDNFKKVERIGKKPTPGTRPGGRSNNRPGYNRHRDAAPQPRREDPQAPKKPIKMGETISVKELGEKLGKQAAEIIKKLMVLGVMATINQELDFDTATLIAADYGVEVERLVDKESEEVLLKEEEDKPEDLKARPPVVTIMGHVDHGKTSLLDAIRQTNVIATEAGGITQHIGAYTVNIQGKKIAFLDTPGHEAFTAMRARGAKVTDIAILVVAADDGIMPQTIEAINHAKAAGVAIIVAINKIDKEGANPDRIKQELTEYGLVAEEWGGETICVPVSAKKRENIDGLLEMILLVAEMQELKANANKMARGTVIEAQLDKGKGPVATVLVQSGTLNVGDVFVVGNTYGKIRAMLDDKGKKVKKAGPSTPVEIQGLSEVPDAGDLFIVLEDEKTARLISEKRKEKLRMEQLQSKQKISLDDLFSHIQEGKVKDLNIIVKADVQGSVEAVKQSLARLSNNEVKVNTIHGGVGAITESDVMLADASNAIIIGFNVRPQPAATALAERNKVDIRLYRVIYNAIEDIEAAMKGMLEPEYKEVILGHAEIRATFKVSSVGTIAGCYVTDGKINRNNDIRLIRNGIVIHEGKLASLKRFKDDVKEVNSGYECGLNIDRFNDIKEGDVIEAFAIETVPRK